MRGTDGVTRSQQCRHSKRRRLLFACVPEVRTRRRYRAQAEVTLVFVDAKKAHLNAKIDEEEWVALPEQVRINSTEGTPS